MENRFFLNAKNPEALYFKAFGIQYCIIARYDRELQHCRLNHQLLLYCIIARYDWYIYRIVTDFLDESTSKSAIGPPHIIFIAAYWFSVIFNDLTEPF